MDTRRQSALDYHSQGKPGKIAVTATKPVATQRQLSLAYSPGVAEPCLAIHADPEDAFKYTARANLVAVVSNGTAVLGLGNIGPLAAKPVMEGKAVLFKRFAGIDVFDIEVDTEDPEELIRFCQLLEPTVGGINLEDISAPACFVVEERLKESMDIPVFHDDQHGTAIIAGAALLNGLDIVGKAIAEVRVVFSGAGASALATATHFTRLGVRRENMLVVDSKGVIYSGRPNTVNEYKARFAVETAARTLTQALVDADVLVGLSVKGAVTGDMVAAMAPDPMVFALANPDPEITPEEVHAVRPDAITATGRSDYPNQVNNVLGFPFLFRGALDVRAQSINPAMMMAATQALAELAHQQVPEAVARAYSGETFQFGRTYLIPKPFDPRVLWFVAPAVAKAAMDSGVARATVDLDEYRDRLRASLGPGREVMRWVSARARARPMRVVLADGQDPRVIRAAVHIVEEGVARPILLGRPKTIRSLAGELGLALKGIEIVNPASEREQRKAYVAELFKARRRRGLTLAEARDRMLQPLYFGCMMIRSGDADAVVAGVNANYPDVIRPALEVVGTADGVQRVCGLSLVALPERAPLFFADTTVNIDPTAEQLADIAVLAADFVRELGLEPRVALLSFSNFGSAANAHSRKVSDAVRLVRARDPGLEIDGEMQADTAVNASLLRKNFPFSTLSRSANVLIFPDLGSANIAYKLLAQLGGAEVIGPILLGTKHPVHVLQRGSTSLDVLNLATIASVDAQTPFSHN